MTIRRAIRSMLELHPDWSMRRIAEHVGAAPTTVCTVKRELLPGGEESAPDEGELSNLDNSDNAGAQSVEPADPFADHGDENEARKESAASERLEIARQIEARVKEEVPERRGRPAADEGGNSAQLCGISDPPAGEETREFAARKAGFTSREQRRRAEVVVSEGTPELVEAMDKGDVSISAAAKAAKLPAEPAAASAVRRGARRGTFACPPRRACPTTGGRSRRPWWVLRRRRGDLDRGSFLRRPDHVALGLYSPPPPPRSAAGSAPLRHRRGDL